MKNLDEAKTIILRKLQSRIDAYNAASTHYWLFDQMKHTFYPPYPGKYGYHLALTFSQEISLLDSWPEFNRSCLDYYNKAGPHGIALLKDALEEITGDKFIFPFINYFVDFTTSYETEQHHFILRCLNKLQQDVPMQPLASKMD